MDFVRAAKNELVKRSSAHGRRSAKWQPVLDAFRDLEPGGCLVFPMEDTEEVYRKKSRDYMRSLMRRNKLQYKTWVTEDGNVVLEKP